MSSTKKDYKEWNKIYTISPNAKGKIQYKERKEFNIQLKNSIYVDKSKGLYGDIEDCVKYAITNKNHLAFVTYYLEHLEARKQLFREKLVAYMEKAEVSYGKIRIISETDGFWRYYGAYLVERGNKWFVKIDDTSASASEYKCCVSDNTIRGWFSGSGLPGRDELIQLGVYLELNHSQIDELLNLAGYSALYKPDLIDSICIYYLNKYSSYDDEGKYSKSCKLSGMEKLMVIKDMINSKGEGKYRSGVFKKIKKQATPSSSTVYPYVIKNLSHKEFLAYDEIKDKWNIEEELEQIIEDIPDLEKYENRVTYFMNNKYSSVNTEKDLEAYLDSEISIFDNKRFGLFKVLSSYLRDMDEVCKNLFHYNGHEEVNEPRFQLTFDEDVDLSLEKVNDELGDQRIYLEDYKKKSNANTVRVLLNAIFHHPNMIEKNPYEQYVLNDKAFFSSRSEAAEYLSGREIASSDKDTLYQLGITYKDDLIKLCVALGREDNLVEVMNLAGFVGYGDKKYVYDGTDSIVSYAISYRDALIDSWVKKNDEDYEIEQIYEYKNEIKNNFPFVRLMMEIYRDIQLVKKFEFEEKHRPLKEKLNSNSITEQEEKQINEQIKELYDHQTSVIKEMLFPIKYCFKIWFVHDDDIDYRYLNILKKCKLKWFSKNSGKDNFLVKYIKYWKEETMSNSVN